MSYSKNLIREFQLKIPGMGGSDAPAASSGSGGSTTSGSGSGGGGGGGMSPAAIMGLIGSGKQIISSLGKEQIGLAGAEAERVASATLKQVPATAAASSKAATQAAIDTAFTRPNLMKAGAAALAGGALIGGGLALGRRIGNIGSRRREKEDRA